MNGVGTSESRRGGIGLAENEAGFPPLDLRQARRLVAGLPEDPTAALGILADALRSLRDAADLKPERRFEIIDFLDGAGHPRQRELGREYGASRLPKYRENQWWTVVHEYWRQLARAYLLAVEQYQAGVRGADRLDLRRVAGRAMRAMAAQLKWDLLRYGPVHDRVWGDLARVYLVAETQGFAAEEVAIYPDSVSSVQQELMRALLLCLTSPANLTPTQIDITERIVSHCAGSFGLTALPTDDSTHYFDLAMRRPPARLAGVRLNSAMRFFNADAACPQLTGWIEAAEAGQCPLELGLDPAPELPAVLDVLRHLAQHWGARPSARGSQRRRSLARLSVVHGFDAIVAVLSGAGPVGDAESWVADNSSEGGYGAIVPKVNLDWVAVGCLVGIRVEGGSQWGVGVIRRLSHDARGQRHIGIQMIAKAAALLPLPPAADVTVRRPPALVLSTVPDHHGEIRAIVRRADFGPDESVVLPVGDKRYLLAPSARVETGDDYELIRFRVVQRIE